MTMTPVQLSEIEKRLEINRIILKDQVYVKDVSDLLAYCRNLEWENNIFKNEVKSLLQSMPIADEDSCGQSICELCLESEWSCNECPPVSLAKLVGLVGDAPKDGADGE